MLVTFTTKAHADITMFGDVAVSLLKMMGHTGAVPGALLVEDIGPALEQLQAALQQVAQPDMPVQEDELAISISVRAMPLIELMQSAIREQTHISWSSN